MSEIYSNSSEDFTTASRDWSAQLRLEPRHLPAALVLALGDALIAAAAIIIATLIISAFRGSEWSLHTGTVAIAAMISLLAVNAQVGLYDTAGQGPIQRFRLRILGVTLMPWPSVAIVAICGGAAVPAAGVLAVAWALLLPLCLLAEAITRRMLLRGGIWGESAVLIGSDIANSRLAAHLSRHPELGLHPIGCIAAITAARVAEDPPGLGTDAVSDGRAGVTGFTSAASIAVVSLSPDMPPLDPARLPFGRVIVVPDISGMPALWVSSCGLGETAGFAFANRTDVMADHRIKRLFDLSVAVPLLILTLPVLGLLPALIKLVSPGPAFYTQQRIGLGGKQVSILKLRTMYPDAEARLQDLLSRDAAARREWDHYMKLSRDPRILPVIGNLLRRTSLDELPQLWNVIRGDISLVGPRPFPAYHVSRFDPAFQKLRSRVKPGLTGLWQVTERSNADLARQEAIDTFYIRNWSLWLDFYIVMQTVPALLTTRGAR